MTRWVLVYGPVWLPVSSDNLFCVHGADPRIPDQLPGGTRTVSGRTLCVGPVASEISVTRMYGPSAVAGPAQLLVDGVLGLAQIKYMLPVGDATALGTFRTRLETRTKESNMCASHWDRKT